MFKIHKNVLALNLTILHRDQRSGQMGGIPAENCQNLLLKNGTAGDFCPQNQNMSTGHNNYESHKKIKNKVGNVMKIRNFVSRS